MTDPPAHSTPPAERLTRLPRNVWVLTLTSFLTDVSSEMLHAILPLFLADVLGARTAVIGLIEGMAETTSSVVKIGSGWLSDRMGRRKWLTVAGYMLSSLAKPLLLFASAWGWVFAVRFADRVGKGIRTAPRDALLAASIDPPRRGLAFGLHRAGDTAGAAVGLLIALLVVGSANPGSLRLTRGEFQTLVLLGIVPAFAAVVALIVGVKDLTKGPADSKPEVTKGGPLGRRFWTFLAIIVVFTLGNSSDAFLVLRARSVGLPISGVVAMMLTFNLIYAAISGPAGALSDRIGRRGLIVGGWLIYALIYLGFAHVRNGAQAWALMAVYGAYYGLTEGAAKALVADLVPADRRGTAYGVYNAAVGLAALPASLIAGLLWQGTGEWNGFGPQAPFLFGAFMALCASLFMAGALGGWGPIRTAPSVSPGADSL